MRFAAIAKQMSLVTRKIALEAAPAPAAVPPPVAAPERVSRRPSVDPRALLQAVK
jgi:hypothetical protein